MAKADILAPFIRSHEGGFANHPKDPGGATNKGVTLKTYQSFFPGKTVEDLKKITDQEWNHIFKSGFWDKVRADEIHDQSVANLIADWAYNSGVGGAAKEIQKVLGVPVDGIIGPKTIEAINTREPKELFASLHQARGNYYRGLKNFSTFGKGWMNRLNSIGYGSLSHGGTTTKF